MFKFAFFCNSTTLTPENYCKELSGTDFKGRVYGVNSLEVACSAAKRLADEGFDEIDLCGDFDEAMALEIKKSAGSNVEIWYERYFDSEREKLEALSTLNPWGIIIEVGESWEKDRYSILKSEECDTYIACVNGMEDAIRAAEQMVRDGVTFIELCSYYDEEKTKQLIEGIGGAVPIGYPAQA